MSSKTTYKCDVCKSKVTEEFLLQVYIKGVYVCDNVDLCTWDCLIEYIEKRRKTICA